MTPERVIDLAAESGLIVKMGVNIHDHNGNGYPLNDWLMRFTALVEEECATVCDLKAMEYRRTRWDDDTPMMAVGAESCADAIREQGTPHEGTKLGRKA